MLRGQAKLLGGAELNRSDGAGQVVGHTGNRARLHVT